MLYIVDDDELFAGLLKEIVKGIYPQVELFHDPLVFIEKDLLHSDVIFLDIKMPKMDGIEILRQLSKKNCQAKLILISGFDSQVLHSTSMLANEIGLNVVAKIAKPANPQQIRKILTSIINSQGAALPIKETISPTTSYPVFLREDIEEAMISQQFILFYQPQIDLQTNKLIGIEALVRWQHPTYGLIPPNNFIGLIQKYQLMEELTNTVIMMAVEQEKTLKSFGYNIIISVNVSASNVTSLTLPEKLEELINHAQINPSMICLEVTESELMGELISSIDTLTRMRLKGFKLSIDDFGTGYSSLLQLYRIPFNELKIDQSFIKNLRVNPESKIIVDTCITLAHKLGMTVVAEGIEDQETLILLQSMGCDVGQGYYISRPQSVANIILWIDEKIKNEPTSIQAT